ncbi:uncharacterized protein LOC123870472 [Maniola jurtina]|uniref:uncharacterized protein LOC123870472 n=1 Tax=Maniola jurtina TaxID=191418 RepID=UPI001E68C2C2|nr:uncharacterized protein LOC123870472 [Maniola jurtina]
MTLSCNNCRVVICELLTYVKAKLSVADEDSIVRICAATFSSEEIEESYKLLVDSLPQDLRKTARRGKGKENRFLNDIISLFKGTDPDVLPVFVARDLDKLPPITFDHLDVSKLLKDLAVVQAEIKDIKSSYVTIDQLEKVRTECQSHRYTSPPFSAAKVNMKRGAYRDSGPIGLSQLDDTIITNHSDRPNVESSSPRDLSLNYRSINYMEGSAAGSYKSQRILSGEGARAAEQVSAAGAGGAGDVSSQPAVSAPSAQPASETAPIRAAGVLSFAEVTKTEGEWNVVQRRKPKTRSYRYQGVAGVSNDENCNFKAADRKVPIFITMIHKDTTEKDIMDYVYNKTKEHINLEKISFLRGNKDYNAYKFFVSERKIEIFLDATLWPEGVIFRRFVNFKRNNRIGANGVATNTVNGPTPTVNG